VTIKKMYKTPLRYPGGKSRAMNYLLPQMPEIITEFRDSFVGGGSVFLSAMKEYPDADFWINDAYYNLYCFWKELRDNGDGLVEILTDLKTKNIELMTKSEIKEHLKECGISGKEKSQFYKDQTQSARALFNYAKEKINDSSIEDIMRATYFYILNKCSFSGLTETGTFSSQASIQNFSEASIKKLLQISHTIQNVKITNLNYNETFSNVSGGTFIFLDPPYDIGKQNVLYGKNGEIHAAFEHDKFAEDCKIIESNFMITYNNSDANNQRFSDFTCSPWSLKYGMRIVENSSGKIMAKDHTDNELLIVNYY
jgi:site-specific DNA-adenine methylase